MAEREKDSLVLGGRGGGISAKGVLLILFEKKGEKKRMVLRKVKRDLAPFWVPKALMFCSALRKALNK